MKNLQRDRLLELLADQTIFGLSQEEYVELEELKKQFPDWEKDFSLELAATAIGLSNLEVSDDLPADLRARIFAGAEEFFAAQETSQKIVGFAPPAEKTIASSTSEKVLDVTAEASPKRPVWQWLGWGLAAAAACLVIAFGLWSTQTRNQTEIVRNPDTSQNPEIARTPETVRTPETGQTPEAVQIPESTETPEALKSPETVKTPEVEKTPESVKSPRTAQTPAIVRTPEPLPARTPAPELTAAQRREQLLASAPDVIQTNWVSAKDDKKVLGDVVWSNAQQKGYLRLRGMPVLDASRETYQLWIVDERNEKTPVSGGIFNVGGAGEIIIPINAQTRIVKPKQFAVTKEKAGGVIVSKPDRIVAVAKI